MPTFNEEADIAETLHALVGLSYPRKEIIVVDDSTDSTPEIVRRYGDQGVRLIRPEQRKGRCEARNIGILAASGEVVVILNADVRPRPDFLQRLVPHYERGSDYVLVRSRVANPEALLARYVYARGAWDYAGHPSRMEWTEGFSCRRESAIKAGLFPEGFAVPIAGGEDGYFGRRLRDSGAKKTMDLTITVDHIAPATVPDYWRVRKGRGKAGPQVRRFLQTWSIRKMVGWAFLRVVKTTVLVLSILPMFVISWRASRHSPHGIRDLFPFVAAWLIEQGAFHAGEWESIYEIVMAEKGKASG